jgi:multiple sugar transport system substrate-binding protein
MALLQPTRMIFSNKKGTKLKLRDFWPLLSKLLQNTYQVLLVVVLAIIVFGQGCHQPTEQSPVRLKLSSWGSAEEISVLQSLLDEFQRQYPRIRVELIHIPDNYFQKLHILIAGDLTPDVMFVNSLGFPVYAENQILAPLDRFLSPHQSSFFQPALQALSWKGHVYAIPRDISDLVVYYNQDLFKKAGVPIPSPQWTMQDLVSVAQKLTQDQDGDGKPDRFGISFFGKPPHCWLPFVWSSGGDSFNSALTAVQLSSPRSISALQFYADLRNRWHVAPKRAESGSATMSQLFLEGKLAMLVSGRWTTPILRQQATFRWDILPFPRGQAGSVVGIDASGYAISKTTLHPQESRALVEFLSSRQAQAAFAKSGLIVPARKDVAEAAAFTQGAPLHSRYFLEALANGHPTHVPVRWNEISETLDLTLEPVWEGSQSAQDAMQKAAPQIEKLLR